MPCSSYRGLRAVVTGATGFIGRWVARRLTAAGADLILIVRDAEAARDVFDTWEIRGETRVVDLADPAAAADMVASCAPHVIFNLAGYGVDRSERDPDLAERMNTRLPTVLADAIATRPTDWPGQRIVHAGSALEYGEQPGDLSEDGPVAATTLYGRTKLGGTRGLAEAAEAHGLAACTARLFTIYGSGEHDGRLLPTLLAARATETPVPLSEGLQKRDFTAVGDVVEGLLRLGLAPEVPGRVVNVATGVLTTVRAFVETAASVLGISADRLDFGAVPVRAEEMEHEPVSVSRLQETLGWKPTTSIVDGVRAALEFGES